MSLSASPRGPSLGGIGVAARRLEVVWPVALTALVYAAFLGAMLAGAHGNPDVFVQFGREKLAATRPPGAAPIVPGTGYDGQLYWLQAQDPLLLHASTIGRLAATSASFSLQRVAYPALAWLLAAGRAGGLGWSLLSINLVAVLGLTTAVALDCRRHGRHPGWALVVGLCPGMLVATSRDLSDVLATSCLIGGLLAFRRGRAGLAGLLLAVAALAREPMVLAPVAVAVELGWRALHAPNRRAAAGELRRDAVTVVVPILAYVAWKGYALTRTIPHVPGTSGSLVDHPIFPPFAGLRVALGTALSNHGTEDAFRLPYLLLVAGAVVVSLLVLRRGLVASSMMAALYGTLVISAISFGDDIELTRYTMPMFLCLLLTGLDRRSRTALGFAAAASATVVLLPLVGG